MYGNFTVTGIVYKTTPKEKYSELILKYLDSGNREQHTPFKSANKEVNQDILDLKPGTTITIDGCVGGREWKGQFYSTNWIHKITY